MKVFMLSDTILYNTIIYIVVDDTINNENNPMSSPTKKPLQPFNNQPSLTIKNKIFKF